MKNTITNWAVIACLTLGPANLAAQNTDTGWLEGTAVDAKGRPVWVTAFVYPDFKVKAVHSNGTATETVVKADMGGLFSMKDLRPGVYDVFVPASRNDQGKYRPQLIRGVVVKPGTRTKLSIVVLEGELLQEVARPVATDYALIVADELARLTRLVEQLQRQVDSLQRQVSSKTN